MAIKCVGAQFTCKSSIILWEGHSAVLFFTYRETTTACPFLAREYAKRLTSYNNRGQICKFSIPPSSLPFIYELSLLIPLNSAYDLCMYFASSKAIGNF